MSEASEVKEISTEFPNGVIDIGYGLLPAIAYKETKNYLEENKLSYTGVEIGDEEIDVLGSIATSLKQKKSGLNVRAIKGSFASEEIIEELTGKGNQVWIRNFRGLGQER